MLSNEQYMEKERRVKAVVTSFLKQDKTILEISKDTKIPPSSVQRYLNDVEFIKSIYGLNSEFIIEEIKRKLLNNYQVGVKQGGLKFAENNTATKDSNGHFTGSIRKK